MAEKVTLPKMQSTKTKSKIMEGLEDHLPNARELPEQKHAEYSLHVLILACHYLRR